MRRTYNYNLGRPKWVKFHVEHNSSNQIQDSINEFFGQRDFSARDLFIKFNSCILKLTFVPQSIFTRSISLNETDRTFGYLVRSMPTRLMIFFLPHTTLCLFAFLTAFLLSAILHFSSKLSGSRRKHTPNW